MRIVIDIDLDNAAYAEQSSTGAAIAVAASDIGQAMVDLRDRASTHFGFWDGPSEVIIRDTNGNRVGTAKFTPRAFLTEDGGV